jgi:hypothetical protein
MLFLNPGSKFETAMQTFARQHYGGIDRNLTVTCRKTGGHFGFTVKSICPPEK